MVERVIVSKTESVCPICLKKIDARRVAEGEIIWLEKSCPEHGDFCVEIWGGHVPYEEWNRSKEPSSPVNPAVAVDRGCPFDCGLCSDHRQHSCCVLLEVTARCNLTCPVCFASSGDLGDDPPIENLLETLADLLTRGGPMNIQLSGGEPTMRDDLPVIIERGKAMGHPFFQLNTNGIRVAQDPTYAQTLADAGLDCVFLQFDGLSDEIYRQIRGRELLSEKITAIQRCEEAGIGVVLVPTICADINTSEIGPILDFAAKHISAVRGVHFQPMTYMGRYPEGAPVNRFTLSHLLFEIEKQTNSKMKMADFSPGGAENAYCSFSASYFINDDGTWQTKVGQDACACSCGSPVPIAADRARQARAYVAKAWKGTGRPKLSMMKAKPISDSACCPTADSQKVTGHACCPTADFQKIEDKSCCPTVDSQKVTNHACCPTADADKSSDSTCCPSVDSLDSKPSNRFSGTQSLDAFLENFNRRQLAVSAMAFMDAWNLDLDRLRDCYIHVADGKRLIPFCAYNLSSQDGQTLYRPSS